MQVTIKKNYRGPLGTFKAGEMPDLHPRLVQLLPKDVVEKEMSSPRDKQMRPDKPGSNYRTK